MTDLFLFWISEEALGFSSARPTSLPHLTFLVVVVVAAAVAAVVVVAGVKFSNYFKFSETRREHQKFRSKKSQGSSKSYQCDI